MSEEQMAGDQIEQKMRELEEDPPKNLEDWPTERALRNKTFGGPEGDHGYDEGPERKLGPSSLVHEPGGSVTIDGETVDDPDQYKGDPIPGGPTDERTGRPEAEEPADGGT
jgi:hypothetical protein